MRGKRRQRQGGCGTVCCCRCWPRNPLPHRRRQRALVRREQSTGLRVSDTPTPPSSPPPPRSVRLWPLVTAAACRRRHHTRGGTATGGGGSPATSGSCQADCRRRRRGTAVPVATGPAGGHGRGGAAAGRPAALLLPRRGGSPRTAARPHSPARPGGAAGHRRRRRGRSSPPGSRVCQPRSLPLMKLFSSVADSRRPRTRLARAQRAGARSQFLPVQTSRSTQVVWTYRAARHLFLFGLPDQATQPAGNTRRRSSSSGWSPRGARPAVGSAELLNRLVSVGWHPCRACLEKGGGSGRRDPHRAARGCPRTVCEQRRPGRPAAAPPGGARRRQGGDGGPPRAFPPATVSRRVGRGWCGGAPPPAGAAADSPAETVRCARRSAAPPLPLLLTRRVGPRRESQERRRPAVAAAAVAAAVATRDRRGKPARRWAVSSRLVCDASGSGRIPRGTGRRASGDGAAVWTLRGCLIRSVWAGGHRGPLLWKKKGLCGAAQNW